MPYYPQGPGQTEQSPRGSLSRRSFLAAGAGSLALTILDGTCCSDAAPPIKSGTHHIPPDKGLDLAWVEGLYAKGSKKVYTGDELTCIGMPIGGIPFLGHAIKGPIYGNGRPSAFVHRTRALRPVSDNHECGGGSIRVPEIRRIRGVPF
jgi:hypothetical protein